MRCVICGENEAPEGSWICPDCESQSATKTPYWKLDRHVFSSVYFIICPYCHKQSCYPQEQATYEYCPHCGTKI